VNVKRIHTGSGLRHLLLLRATLLLALTFLISPLQAESGTNRSISRYADDCSTPIDPKQWKLQRSNDQFALFCDKQGEEKKCACVKGSKY
jgi:hypothetical protein